MLYCRKNVHFIKRAYVRVWLICRRRLSNAGLAERCFQAFDTLKTAVDTDIITHEFPEDIQYAGAREAAVYTY
ncbi:hypothetical protein GCM10008066_02790 [Oxalicibacterium faecigallinarum]|uniref:Uncharacterized protein n=1 Tax=Oxalicibacterium faecigallinarum TaxID=573741 RepID=A0A8J3F0Q1_9BURK|nr:hypothetical protein GCM10008066_02790 [Oxalicibacterium faecigallinarum]